MSDDDDDEFLRPLMDGLRRRIQDQLDMLRMPRVSFLPFDRILARAPRKRTKQVDTTQKAAILAAIAKHPEWEELGRNKVASELAKLGLGESHARQLVTQERRGGHKKVVSGQIVHLVPQ